MTGLLDVGGVTSRGELLRRADAEIAAADRALTSLRRTLPVVVWSFGLMVMLFVQGGADLDSNDAAFAFLPALVILWWLVARVVPGKAFIGHLVAFVVIVAVGSATTPVVDELDGAAARTFFLVVWAALAIGVAWNGWTYIATGRRLLARIDTARSLRRDPALLGLDASDVTPEIATVHDLRDRADYDEVVGKVVARHMGRLFELRTIQPVFALMVTGVMGLAFLLAPLVGLDDSAWAPASAVSGLLLLVPWAWAGIVDMNQAILGRQVEANQVTVESRLYAVRRHRTRSAAIRTSRRPSLLGSPAGLLLLVAWIGILVVRIRTSSGLAILLALALVLVVSAWFFARYVRLSRQARVFPLAGSGDSVLQAPAREIVLDLAADGLRISDESGRAEPHVVPLDDIIAVEPLTGLSAMSRDGVGIVTRDAPIVLAGRSIHDDPAIVELRQHLADR
ncbi:MAG: hypothetical protein JWQ91_1856 [Aeromicrobium sp.]|uniref:hypothetical protein n=1 Tax=Aeromicrobium sp. TaxID=1871063 RepID=UPI00260E596B|nr:hypothetical protein [Aeromicrobium sp.]MCW2824939.1 hypothetical protein [Aeromicrobium sp.]